MIKTTKKLIYVRFHVLTAASMKFRIVFWDVLIPDDGGSTYSETLVDYYFTRQYIPEDNSEVNLDILN
jgi:hypothetical protein